MDAQTVDTITAHSIGVVLDRIEAFSHVDGDFYALREAVNLRRWADVAAKAEQLAGRYERMLSLTTDEVATTLGECAVAYLRSVVRYASAAADGRLAD